MSRLPVSIVCPVRNCINEMPAHAEHLRQLARIVGEVIIVDSDSSDGTAEFLKDKLADCGAVFLNHPPGLYPSWNYGISKAKFPYLTVATVGDNLPPGSLVKLHRDLDESGCDVVISAPTLINPDGTPSSSRWPIHRMIDACGLSGPQRINQAWWLALALGFFPKSPMASSSGNLYRTGVFRDNLFPTNCGHRGDVIWAITSARKARWMIDPTVESCFKFNPPSAHRQPPADSVIAEWKRTILCEYEMGLDFMAGEGVPEWFLTGLRGNLENSCLSLSVDTHYRSVRQSPLPWFLHPRAIRLRRQRRISKKQNAAKLEMLARFMKDLDVCARRDV